MRLIDYDKLVETVKGCSDNWTPRQREGAELMLDIAEFLAEETVDAVEVVRWIRMDAHKGMEQFKCSACRSECYVPTCMAEPLYAYCPNCGAKMDGGAEEDDL